MIETIIDPQYVVKAKVVSFLTSWFGNNFKLLEEIRSFDRSYDGDTSLRSASAPDIEINVGDIPRAFKRTVAPFTTVVQHAFTTSEFLSSAGQHQTKVTTTLRIVRPQPQATEMLTDRWQPIASGHTSVVYAAQAELSWVSPGIGAEHLRGTKTFKVAIKKMKPEIPARHFLEEFKRHLKISEPGHPNLAHTIMAYIEAEGRRAKEIRQRFNLAFPLASGSLKELLRGTFPISSLQSKVEHLWAEFEGLADAVRYLHHNCRIAHRDIKPSNILLYEDFNTSRLKAKIADFGIAIDLEGLEGLVLDADSSVEDFRRSITVHEENTTSDTLTPFDDGEKVRQEVLDWLSFLSARSRSASELHELLIKMLGAAETRPTSEFTANKVRKMSFSSVWDGSHVLHFLEADDLKATFPVGHMDRFKEFVEHNLASPVNWWPFKQGHRSCPGGHMRIAWEWAGEELYVDVPHKDGEDYKGNCAPMSSLPPDPTYPRATYQRITSSANPSTSYTQAINSTGFANTHGNTYSPIQSHSFALNGLSGSPSHFAGPPIVQQQGVGTELYWCVPKPWTKTKDLMASVIDINTVHSDSDLFKQLNKAYAQIRGRFCGLVHWKSCQDIAFIEFAVVYDDEQLVVKSQDGLPPLPSPPFPPSPGASSVTSTLPRYEYFAQPPPTTHMKITARQIVGGMNGYYLRPRSTITLNAIPKYLFASVGTYSSQTSGMQWKQYRTDWGICAVQGWVLWKILLSVLVMSLLGWTVFVVWLVCVDSKDLQNASVPFFMLMTWACVSFGIVQFSDGA
ncbi:hypothetical protein FB567DRAFT_592753 [Paraphoma chrysanthemicola]|uniref:Protein kinase domain-containing protein n=1 Tax=Paraphoma chrysanthemicola TaxID=798071 RepID=A0A8K0R5T3_9PLEO|nr:hypothetical protein FB567DRAFT_592753 [Paraphoma chrysanthemicola]